MSTAVEGARRLLRRADKRDAQTAKVEEQRSWFQGRIKAAQERRALAAAAREEAGPSAAALRVPEHIQAVEGLLTPMVEVSETGTSVVAGKTVHGNYADRRAQGARGKARKPRRREMPGAMERRVVRNRAAWN